MVDGADRSGRARERILQQRGHREKSPFRIACVIVVANGAGGAGLESLISST